MSKLIRVALVTALFAALGFFVFVADRQLVDALGEGTTITTVNVQSATGQPLANVGVYLHPAEYGYGVYSQSDENGQAVVQDYSNTAKVGDTLIASFYPPGNDAGVMAPDDITLGAYTGSPYATRTVKFKVPTKTLTGKATTKAGVVVANMRLFFYKQGGGYKETTTDANGNYTAKLSGGTWYINADGASKFSLPSGSMSVTFASDETTEQQTYNLDDFVTVDAALKGKLVTPDGAALPQGISISAESGHELYFNGMVNADGTFAINVTGDRSYSLNIYTPMTGQSGVTQYGPPILAPQSLITGETKDLGTISLSKKDKAITIKVKNGTSGMAAMVFTEKGGSEFGMATLQTVTAGGVEGQVMVSGRGTYGVMVMADGGGMMGGGNGQGGQQQQQSTSNRVVKGGSQFVTAPSTVTFEALVADATLKGRIVNANTSTVLGDGGGFIEVNNDQIGFLGTPMQRGSFELKVPSGQTYSLNPMLESNGFMVAKPASVTLVANETKSVDIKMVPTNAAFRVSYIDTAGNPIKGIFANAFAVAVDGTVVPGKFGGMETSASTAVNVVAARGPYKIGAWIEPNAGYVMIPPTDTFALVTGETKPVKITLQSLDSTISGKVTDPAGNPVIGAFVRIDTGDDQTQGVAKHFFEFGGQTDKNGNYTLKVTSNQTHTIRVFVPPATLNANGWIAPAEQAVTVGAQETKTNFNLQFRKADLKIAGTVSDALGVPISQALVSGYAQDGAVNQVETDATGNYSLSITQGTVWHLDVSKDSGQDAYILTQELLIDTTGKTGVLTHNFVLEKKSNVLVASATRSASSDNASSLTLGDGMTVQVPADALDAKNNGAQATVNINPTVEIPNQEGLKTIGTAYDVTASVGGEAVTTPRSALTLTIPYKESDLPAGVTEANLQIVSFDESTGALRVESGVTIDKDKNLITVSVSHLTVFGIAANADTTPPAAPSNGQVEVLSVGSALKLTWTNTTDSDFNHLAIYRSTVEGQIGTKVKDTAKTDVSFEDTGLSNGTKYFYTLRSVDTVGNESTNTTQISGTPALAVVATPAPSESSTTVVAAVVTDPVATASVLPKTGASDSLSWLGLLFALGLAIIGSISLIRYVSKKSLA